MNSVSMLGAIFGIDTWFYKLLYSLMQGILKLADTVYQVVLTLCGMKKESSTGDSLLEVLAKDSTVEMVFKWVCVLGVCVLGVVICIAVIRAVLSRKLDDPVKAQKGIATRTISSVIIMVLIPIFFFTFISLVGDITQYIINSMNISTETGQVMNSAYDWSVAQEVFETATNQDCSYLLSAESFANLYDISPDGVNYIIGIFGGAIVLVAMFMMGFKLSERIFMLIFYYIISPIIIAISPLDDGSRFNIWKDSVIAKFASRGGEIVANLVGDNIGANEGRETADSLRKAMAGVNIGSKAVLGATMLAGGVAKAGTTMMVGTKTSRALGNSNDTLSRIYDNESNGQKARKGTGVSSIADGFKNIRRYGVLGGSYQNYKNHIMNDGASKYGSKTQKKDDNSGKAKKN